MTKLNKGDDGLFLSLSNEYSSILEFMHYFYFEFNIYIILLIIMIINCLKVFKSYRRFISKNINESYHFSDIIISIFCEIAFANAIMLQGVIADISGEASELWFNKVFAISVLSFLVFIVQIYFTSRLIQCIKHSEDN